MPTKNHLAKETSPYLLQHANNPVDWYPWGEEALQLARDTQKPILLSIGYSACHWCHVMAHESFENKKTAEIMNEHFINIKVDREERPDLDKIYQIAFQILTGKPGGWPLTMFLTPENQLPFFGGTYFPDTTRHGLPSFQEVLKKVADFYHSYSSDIHELTEKVQQALDQLSHQANADGVQLNSDFLPTSCQAILNDYDPIHGGFGKQPKFPQASQITQLLRCHLNQPDEKKFLEAATFTLHRMANGGLFDQLGGGFFRYCVDDKWQIPHFEKMLYDNAQLIEVYAQAYQINKDPYFKTIIEKTANWVIDNMQSQEGGYYSTINADSEGIEGKYYYWDRKEIATLLTEDEFAIVEKYFGLDRTPNFEDHYHLIIANDLENSTVAEKLLDSAKNKLLAARKKRIVPDRDEKILCSWNGLMIKSLCVAGRYLNHEKWIDSAEAALAFIFKHLYKDHRLFSIYKNNQAKIMGHLDDYVFLLAALIEYLQVRWNSTYYQYANQLATTLFDYFYDQENGGFYFTANDHEKLIQRPKSFTDESIPSGNGIAASYLLKLFYISGNQLFFEMAEKTLQCAWHSMQQLPSAYCNLLFALEDYFFPPKMIILRGESKELKEWMSTLNSHGDPASLIIAIPKETSNLPEPLNKPFAKGETLAYLCEGKTCLEPIDSLKDLLQTIRA